jgi:hypothetical protein
LFNKSKIENAMIVVTNTPAPENGHSIETGWSTWNENENKERVVRNRYSNRNGGFNRFGSSELPQRDLRLMISVVADQDLLPLEDIAEMISALRASQIRRT